MRNLRNNDVDQYRLKSQQIIDLYGDEGDNGNGVFLVPLKDRTAHLRVIASNGMGWDHVSVSLEDRCPTWDEMCMIKDLFFRPTEMCIQYHPAKTDYVNNHPYCLHIWRPQRRKFPKPKSIMVGIK